MLEVTFPENTSDAAFDALTEQAWYLQGLLAGDAEHAEDETFDFTTIDRFGTGTIAFWRGFVDRAGSAYMRPAGAHTYPRLEISRASYALLCAFLGFLEEHLGASAPRPASMFAGVRFDIDGRLDFQARGGFLKLNAEQSQAAIQLLYQGARVARAKHRRVADQACGWISARKN